DVRVEEAAPRERTPREARARQHRHVQHEPPARLQLRRETADQRPRSVEVLEDVRDPDRVEARVLELRAASLDVGEPRVEPERAAERDVLRDVVEPDGAGPEVDEAVAEGAADVEHPLLGERPVLERALQAARQRPEPPPDHVLHLLGRQGAPRADERLDLVDRPDHSALSRSGCLRTNRRMPAQCHSVRRVSHRRSVTAWWTWRTTASGTYHRSHPARMARYCRSMSSPYRRKPSSKPPSSSSIDRRMRRKPPSIQSAWTGSVGCGSPSWKCRRCGSTRRSGVLRTTVPVTVGNRRR